MEMQFWNIQEFTPCNLDFWRTYDWMVWDGYSKIKHNFFTADNSIGQKFNDQPDNFGGKKLDGPMVWLLGIWWLKLVTSCAQLAQLLPMKQTAEITISYPFGVPSWVRVQFQFHYDGRTRSRPMLPQGNQPTQQPPACWFSMIELNSYPYLHLNPAKRLFTLQQSTNSDLGMLWGSNKRLICKVNSCR